MFDVICFRKIEPGVLFPKFNINLYAHGKFLVNILIVTSIKTNNFIKLKSTAKPEFNVTANPCQTFGILGMIHLE